MILHFMRLKPEIREKVLQILLMLMHKDIPHPKSIKKESHATPESKVYTVPADYLDIREEDAPGIKKLKKLAALDSSQLENLPDDLQPKKK